MSRGERNHIEQRLCQLQGLDPFSSQNSRLCVYQRHPNKQLICKLRGFWCPSRKPRLNFPLVPNNNNTTLGSTNHVTFHQETSPRSRKPKAAIDEKKKTTKNIETASYVNLPTTKHKQNIKCAQRNKETLKPWVTRCCKVFSKETSYTLNVLLVGGQQCESQR